MARLAAGDRSALESVYAALWPSALALAQRWLADAATAEDVAQTALLRLFEQAHRYDPDRPALPWALAIVGWECRTERRRQQRRRTVALSERPDAGQEDQVLQALMVEEAQRVLEQLSPLDRETLELAFSDTPPSERPVAPAAFRKRRQRALSRLRELWESLHG